MNAKPEYNEKREYVVDIADGRSRYRCDSPEKETAVNFLRWWLSGVRGDADIDIRYLQTVPNPEQATLDQVTEPPSTTIIQ